jgi:hypothetical protein
MFVAIGATGLVLAASLVLPLVWRRRINHEGH